MPGALERREKRHGAVVWVMCLHRLHCVSISVHMLSVAVRWLCVLKLAAYLFACRGVEGGAEEEEREGR